MATPHPGRDRLTPCPVAPNPARCCSSAFQAAILGVCLAFTSCASLDVTRDTETSGTFRSSGRSFTLLSWDMPRSAAQIAHSNVADTGLPNIEVTRASVTDWGWFDWILEIVGVRSANVRGTWGYRPADVTEE